MSSRRGRARLARARCASPDRDELAQRYSALLAMPYSRRMPEERAEVRQTFVVRILEERARRGEDGLPLSALMS